MQQILVEKVVEVRGGHDFFYFTTKTNRGLLDEALVWLIHFCSHPPVLSPALTISLFLLIRILIGHNWDFSFSIDGFTSQQIHICNGLLLHLHSSSCFVRGIFSTSNIMILVHVILLMLTPPVVPVPSHMIVHTCSLLLTCQ